MITQDLVVVGGTLAGLSAAIEAQEAGLENVLILEPAAAVVHPELIGQHALRVEYQAPVTRLLPTGNGVVAVETPRLVFTSQVVLMALPAAGTSPSPHYPLPASLAGRLHLGEWPASVGGTDVLVVGGGEAAAEATLRLVGQGARVVLCLGGADPGSLSRLAHRQLLRVEAERRVTILWYSEPEAIEDVGGFPMVYFDRRTPDLQFDHVVFRLAEPGGFETEPRIDVGEIPPGSIFWIDGGSASGTATVPAGEAWEAIRSARYSQLPSFPEAPRLWSGDETQLEALRREHYNATITLFERAHSDLWLLRVKPERGDTTHLAGQYASLGLGYWEPRADGARDRSLDQLWDRLVRRSYSISSPILDPVGYLMDPAGNGELEFYIVLVPPSRDRIPALTPRLALKQPGDQIYLGPKITGRYTLRAVATPETKVLFLATGTGEAPHNSMILELLRKGHFGPILSVVSVRYEADLAYLDVHRALEKRFPNYSYLPLVTRQPGVKKRYVQDLIRDGTIAERLGRLDPENTLVFACGNPAMIGLPDVAEDGSLTFPEVVGVCQILSERGFTVDRRGVAGNIHHEEYW